MKEIPLAATIRSGSGKGAARQTRREGGIPAVVYGPETDPVALTLNAREFRTAMKGSSGGSLFNLDVDGKQSKVVLREIQRDPVTSRVIHVDFLAVSLTKEINVSVSIHLNGIPKGVKTDGGIMQTTMRELEISCLPTDIPESVELDVTDLGIGDSIHVRDIKIEGVKILAEEQRTIVVISAPTVAKVDEAAEEAEAEEAAEGEEGAAEEKSAEEEKKDGKKEE